jgi:membrane-bound lytic murein transglycosylase A
MNSGRWRDSLRAGTLGGAALLLLAAACVARAEGRNPMKISDAQYEPTTFDAIEGWADDDHDAAFETFLDSCRAILKGTPASRPGQPMYAALHEVCAKAAKLDPHKPGEARDFFEQNFRPVKISPLGTPDGFLTGYYEPIAEGAREKADGFDYPLYRKPPNLLPGGRMQITSVVTGKKKKKAQRRKLVPFHDRAAIDDGVLDGRNLEICYLKDPIEAFFAHIQGSVRVKLDDGKLMRLNYQAANGHPYYAVGRWLIERKIVPKDEMSMDRIREWMERNPKEGEELRRKNKSYVFFRETKLANDEEPIGAQGISLTPGRSIAVDRNLNVYGTPFFISAMLPIQSEKPETPFRRLMIAQDTGGAIVGPARADIYFGAGDEAASIAGRMRHNGRFVMLVPRSLDANGHPEVIPIPRPRPPAEKMADDKSVGKAPVEAAAPAKAGKKAEKDADNEPKKPARKHKHKNKTEG